MIRPAISVYDAMAMRRIRNECYQFMTRHSQKFGWWHQLVWWYTLPDNYHPLVFEFRGEIKGYGLVIEQGRKGWLTGALLQDTRAKGHGRKLFEHMIALCYAFGVEPWLEVRRDNIAAIRLYDRLGFEEVERDPQILTMRLRAR